MYQAPPPGSSRAARVVSSWLVTLFAFKLLKVCKSN